MLLHAPMTTHIERLIQQLDDPTGPSYDADEITAQEEQAAAPGLVRAKDCGSASAVQAHEVHGARQLGRPHLAANANDDTP